MENKTISYLNSKTWYRFLKVVFAVAFLAVLSVDILSVVNGFGSASTYFLGFPFPEFPSYSAIQIPLTGIEFLIISIPVIVLIFEAIRRAFYYIVLGSPRPKK